MKMLVYFCWMVYLGLWTKSFVTLQSVHRETTVVLKAYTRGGETAALWAFRKIMFAFNFLLLLQNVEILWKGTVVASVPCSITSASRYKNYDVTEA